MKRTVWLWELCGFAAVSLVGTILHFLYDWSGKSPWIAPFSGVNESTWEHMKLLFWPILGYAAFQSLFFNGYENFWWVKLRGTLLGLALIPILFYTYNGVIGKSPDWLNIAIFFVSAAAMYLYEVRALAKGGTPCNFPRLSLALLCVIALLFVIFTFKTPELGIFRDPIDGTYGIPLSYK